MRALLHSILVLAFVTVLPAHAREMAWVEDSGDPNGPSSGIFFFLEAVDGQELGDNAARASQRASAGRGAYLAIAAHARPVAPGPRKLKLRGAIVNAAPIHSIYRAIFHGGSPDFSGEVVAELQPGRRYKVTGVLDGFRREVWLQEADSGALVGTKIVMPVDPDMLKAMEGARFLCCNLRYEDNWIDDTPWPTLPFVPAGSRIKVLDWRRNEAAVLIDGRRMRIGNAYSREQETIQQMMERLVVDSDPREQLATLEPAVRGAILAGRATPGMTRDQVVMAIGRPRPSHVRDLQVAEWLYLVKGEEQAYVLFGPDGRVSGFDGSRLARSLMWQAPAAVAAAAAPPATGPDASTPPAPATAASSPP